ncbi:MAG: glycosyltransferase [Candidatus Obscuribacterales bacterium]|nr:glycosyltransferase [Candidatus Obscuribacterales bacterium]
MEHKPKILFLGHSAQFGGAELSLVDLVRPYAASAAVLLFEDGPLKDALEAEHILVRTEHLSLGHIRRKSGLLPLFVAACGLIKLIVKTSKIAADFDLLYANTLKSALVAMFAGVLARRPVIIHLRDILSLEHFSRFNIVSFVFLSNWLSRYVIANSNATAQAYIDHGGRANKVVTVYNGFDFSVDPMAKSERLSILREQMELSSTGKVIGCFSRISSWKGQDILLRSVEQLKIPVTVLFVGGPLFGESEFFERLKNLACELGIEERIKFLGFRRDVADLMLICDVVVHPSVLPEPFGRAVVEAMLLGRPVVASAAGGVLEILDDQTGFLFPPADVAALTKTLGHCLENLEEAKAIALKAQEAALNRFSLEKMQQSISSVLRKI